MLPRAAPSADRAAAASRPCVRRGRGEGRPTGAAAGAARAGASVGGLGGGRSRPPPPLTSAAARPAPPLVQMAIVLTRGADGEAAGTEAVPGRVRHAAQRLGGEELG